MNTRTTLLAFAMVSGLAALPTSPATAAPSPDPTYHAGIIDGSLFASIDSATFVPAADGRSIGVIDNAGARLLELPLSFTFDDQLYPIHYQLADEGRALSMTPGIDARPVASPLENQLALNNLATNMITGPLIGTLAGGVLGALLGAAIGLGSCLVIGPGCLVTAPAAIVAFATGGSLLGTLIGGGGALVDGGWKYLTTLNSPPGQSPYANGDGMLDPDGTGVPDANLRLPSGSASGLKAGSSGG
ncbi:hypothetical protein [Nocardia fluminea]|uniref:hypothetical protein n=1 Tax=Nocardia fluminea TaxID=134984 RepID=UPI0034334056